MKKARRKGAIACLSCAVFFAFGVFSYFDARADSVATSATVAVGIIHYDSRGFSPSKITILKGDTLLFRNRSDKILDLSSDPHPERNAFPPLNIGNIPKNGGSAAVLFLETGEFFFHNHSFPSHRGKVIVLDEFAKAPKKAPPKKRVPKEPSSDESGEEQTGDEETESDEEQEDSEQEQTESDSPAPASEEPEPTQEAVEPVDQVIRESSEDEQGDAEPATEGVQTYELIPFLNIDAENSNILIPPDIQQEEGVSEYTIYISENVRSATLDLRYYRLDADGAETPVPIRVISLSQQGTVYSTFSKGTVIHGASGWDGKIELPSLKQEEWGPRLLNYLDDVFVQFMVRVGIKGQKLTLSKPVRLLLPEAADQLIGYVVDDVFTPITAVCDGDTPESAEQQLESEGNCVVVHGSDLAVWTRHFTGFVVYRDIEHEQTIRPATPPVQVESPSVEVKKREQFIRASVELLLGGAALLLFLLIIVLIARMIRCRKN